MPRSNRMQITTGRGHKGKRGKSECPFLVPPISHRAPEPRASLEDKAGVAGEKGTITKLLLHATCVLGPRRGKARGLGVAP